jgi:hypothetical protein
MAQGYTGGNVTPPGTGQVVQVVVAQSTALDSTTSAIPYDTSEPLVTEGKELTALNCTITPQSASSILLITAKVFLIHSSGSNIALVLWEDSTFKTTSFIVSNASFYSGISADIFFKVSAGSTSSRTYKLRYGANSGSTTYVNSDSSGGQLYNTSLNSYMQVMEIKA